MPSDYVQVRRELRRTERANTRALLHDLSPGEMLFFAVACVVMLAGSLAILALIFAGWGSALYDAYHFIAGLL